MNGRPDFLEIKEEYARFRPEGEVSLEQAIGAVGEAIAFCHRQGIIRLLVDTTGLTGFAPPTIAQRFWIAQDWAEKARGSVAVGIVLTPEAVDPNKFEVTAAENAGQTANTFTSESEALEWLLQQKRT
ncbi:hypothetical protein [Pedosphaera parvula]|nr:hypothetical protein [Pedosphaera parvula]